MIPRDKPSLLGDTFAPASKFCSELKVRYISGEFCFVVVIVVAVVASRRLDFFKVSATR